MITPFCSVVVRTQGTRRSLIDTLVALAAQTDRSFEVLLMVHHDDASLVERLRTVVDSFDNDFARTVSVHQVITEGRSAPLNAALTLATGRYLAVIDDDDIVTTQWVAVFRRMSERQPGALVRAGCVVQYIERRATPLLDFEVVSGFNAEYPDTMDFVDSVRTNRSPLCAFAVPLDTVREHGIVFDDTLRVCEDWKFQLDVARLAGVVSDPTITSVYRKWRGSGGSEAAEERDVWITDHERVVDDLDHVPTEFPPGTLRRVHDLYTRIEQLEVELGRRGPEDPPLRCAP